METIRLNVAQFQKPFEDYSIGYSSAFEVVASHYGLDQAQSDALDAALRLFRVRYDAKPEDIEYHLHRLLNVIYGPVEL